MANSLKGKKVVFVVAHEFEDIEVLAPLMRLAEEGVSVTVATLPREAPAHFHPRSMNRAKPITGRFGTTIPFEVLVEGNRWCHVQTTDLDAGDYDGVYFPGGFSPDYLRCDADTLAFVADMYGRGKVVAAICHGPQVLISVDATQGTDIVRGRTVTCFQAVRDDIKNAGGDYVDVPAIRAGSVVTAREPDDIPELCLAMIDALAENDTEGVYDLGEHSTR